MCSVSSSVGELACRRDLGAVGVVGGTGDLQQLARPLDVALLCLLRLDERIDVHRVSFSLLCQVAIVERLVSSARRVR
jgi:hypothetical protein